MVTGWTPVAVASPFESVGQSVGHGLESRHGSFRDCYGPWNVRHGLRPCFGKHRLTRPSVEQFVFHFDSRTLELSIMLRILLSLAMLLPGAPPAADRGNCPFTSVEECRAWLESCCDARDRASGSCGGVENEGASSCDSACGDAETSISCCSAESSDDDEVSLRTEPEAAAEGTDVGAQAGDTCCNPYAGIDSTSVGIHAEEGCCGDSDSESPGVAGPSCPGHSPGIPGQLNCEWCCCCPIRPSRAPERPQAPLPVRSSVEKAKALNAAIVGSIQTNTRNQVRLFQAPVGLPVPSNSRQSVLCVWRE